MLALLIIFNIAHAENAGVMDEYLVPKDGCNHVWTMIADKVVVGTEEYSSFSPTRNTFVDVGDYHVNVEYFIKECSHCGLRQEFPYGKEESHYYFYTNVTYKEQGYIGIEYECVDCDHVRVDNISLLELKSTSLDSTNVSCLHGGACPKSGMYRQSELGNHITVEGQSYSLVRIEDGGHEKLAARLQCPFCGRPAPFYVSSDKVSSHQIDKMPLLSYEAFLEYQIEKRLPYQLLDSLRAIE